jgi:acetyl esterase
MNDQTPPRPPLDHDCAALIEALTAAGGVFDKPDALQMRAAYLKTNDFYSPEVPDLESIKDVIIPATGDGEHAITVRIYRPKGVSDTAPGLVFLHGGGWILGDLETHDALCRILAVRCDAVVISVDYRLAPEHQYPAAVDDCERAWLHIQGSASAFGVDPDCLAMGGDSAGGNLTAAVCRRLRDAERPMPILQLLMYPATDFTATGGSMDQNATGYVLTRERISSMGAIYLGDPANARHPDASPLLADDLSGLPPALVQVAGYDPLRDQGIAYAEKLQAHGVDAHLIQYPTVVHGFMRMIRPVSMAQVGIDDAAAALRQLFIRS